MEGEVITLLEMNSYPQIFLPMSTENKQEGKIINIWSKGKNTFNSTMGQAGKEKEVDSSKDNKKCVYNEITK